MPLSIEEINKLLKQTRGQKFRKRTDAQLMQGSHLRGVKRPDQSARMSGDNNPMAGKVSPNRGKEMPQISDKVKGKAKSDSHRINIGKARTGMPIPKLQGRKRPAHSDAMKSNNPMFKPIRTPHGEFASIKFVIADEKARGTKNAARKIRLWIDTPGSGYEYINK